MKTLPQPKPQPRPTARVAAARIDDRSSLPLLVAAPLFVLLLALLAVAAPLDAATVGWRMDGDGRYPDAQPPLRWSPSESVAWKAEMPSWSNASPVLVDEKIIVLSEPDTVLAVDAASGEILWRDSLKAISPGPTKAHDDNGWTTPTPVSDGKHVFVVLGSGVVAAYTLDGTRQWAKVVQPPEHKWGSSASPILAGGRLVVQRLDLIALDPATGDEIWRVPSEAKWGSPVATTIGDTAVVITPAGDVIRADDGEVVAREIGKLEYATPVVQDGTIYFIEKRATAVALPATLDADGPVFETLWESRIKGSRHYASALVHDGRIYAVSREQDFTILDAATGEVLAEKRLDLDASSGSNSAYPSITLAGDAIYVSAVNGTTVVLEPGSSVREIARNEVEGFRSSPVFDGDRMYLRAFEHLYAFRAAEPAR